MPKYNTKELCLIWLDSISGISYENKCKIFAIIDGAKSIRQALTEQKDKIAALLGDVFNTLLASATSEYLDGILSELDRSGTVAVTVESSLYPATLKNTDIPPLVLYCKGNLELLKENKFAIVGSRKSINLSLSLTKDYVTAVKNCGFCLVTGIAEGVDKTVIETALDLGGKVISVIAGGINNVYPKTHQALVERIAKDNLVIGEYPPNTASMRYFFPVRNRIIAALSNGVLIVSGNKKSGTVYTGEYALEYGKDLFAIPYSVGISSGETPNNFIKRGAFLTDKVEDIYEFYGVEKPQEKQPLSEEEQSIVNLLSGGAVHLEQIAHTLNKEIHQIMPLISALEIKGRLIKSGVNEYALTTTATEE